MKLTDLFVKRPVLAVVVNLVIPDRRAAVDSGAQRAQYPRSDIAVVQVSTVYVGANADWCEASSRPAARPRHRQRRRHRLTWSLRALRASARSQSISSSTTDQPALTQIPVQGRAGAQRLPPEARRRSSTCRRRRPVRRHVPGLLLEAAGPEPRSRLPDACRAAAAFRSQRRASAADNPGRPHLCHAHLAQA